MKKTPAVRVITKAQYYQLVGLIAAAKEQVAILQAMEKAAMLITEERDSDGKPSNGGHTTDMIWQGRELDDGLRILKIKVAKK